MVSKIIKLECVVDTYQVIIALRWPNCLFLPVFQSLIFAETQLCLDAILGSRIDCHHDRCRPVASLVTRFSLRTLLIATTLVAVALGLIVAFR